MSHQRKKSIQYANPGSLAANRLNDGEGCYLVDDESGLPPFKYQTREKQQAIDLFNSINLPIDCPDPFHRLGLYVSQEPGQNKTSLPHLFLQQFAITGIAVPIGKNLL